MEPGARHRTVDRDATVPLRYRDRPAAVPLPRRHRGADRGVRPSARGRDPGVDRASRQRVGVVTAAWERRHRGVTTSSERAGKPQPALVSPLPAHRSCFTCPTRSTTLLETAHARPSSPVGVAGRHEVSTRPERQRLGQTHQTGAEIGGVANTERCATHRSGTRRGL